jgi:glycosyltransferase involved in cell wall biosynthesis
MKFTQDLISIIVPVYNRSNTIERCLNSLLTQTYKQVEIICINDGSSDNSLELLNKYARRDNRINVLSQINKGPASARNVALTNATGEYLMFCDADDEYLPNMCEEMLSAIKENNVDLVMCNAEIILGDAPPTDELSLQRLQVQKENCNSIVENNIINLDSAKRVYLNVFLWNKIFKHEIIVANQISFPEECDHEDDFFIFIYSLFIDKYFALNKTLYRYYINNNSIMHLYEQGKPKNKYDLFKICCHACDFLKKSKKLNENKQALKNFIDFKISMIRTKFFTNEELIDLCKKFNKKFKELKLSCIFAEGKLIVRD